VGPVGDFGVVEEFVILDFVAFVSNFCLDKKAFCVVLLSGLSLFVREREKIIFLSGSESQSSKSHERALFER